MISVFDLHRFLSRQAADQDHKEGSQPGRYEIHNVVQAGSRSAEISVPVISIAGHGVHGIDCFVKDPPDSAEEDHIKQRGSHAVGSILCDCLDSGFRDTLCVQRFRISSDDHGDRPPRSLDIASQKRVAHRKSRFPKTSKGQQPSAKDALSENPQIGMDPSAKIEQQDCQSRAPCQNEQNHLSSGNSLADSKGMDCRGIFSDRLFFRRDPVD